MAEAVRRHRGPVLAFARRLVGDSSARRGDLPGGVLAAVGTVVAFRRATWVAACVPARDHARSGPGCHAIETRRAKHANSATRCGQTLHREASRPRSSRRPSPPPSTAPSRSSRIANGAQSSSRTWAATATERSPGCSMSRKARSRVASAAASPSYALCWPRKTCKVRNDAGAVSFPPSVERFAQRSARALKIAVHRVGERNEYFVDRGAAKTVCGAGLA